MIIRLLQVAYGRILASAGAQGEAGRYKPSNSTLQRLYDEAVAKRSAATRTGRFLVDQSNHRRPGRLGVMDRDDLSRVRIHRRRSFDPVALRSLGLGRGG